MMNNRKQLLMAAVFVLTIGSVQAQSVIRSSAKEVATAELTAKREAQKNEVISSYLALKQDLLVSDSLKAAKSAATLGAALAQFKFKKLTLEEMNTATTMRGKLNLLAQQIADTHAINKQRAYMADLSEGLWTIIDKVTPQNMVLYEQRCPMTSKVWISEVKEIKNPYYPKNMLDCGEVIASAGTLLP
jgi:hypothetical protein